MSLGFDYLNAMLEDDREKGVYCCKREMFTDPRLFDLEMKHIFEEVVEHPAQLRPLGMGAGDLLGKDARAAGGVQLGALVRQILVVSRYPGVTDHRLVFHGAPFVANIVANNRPFATDFCNAMTPEKRAGRCHFQKTTAPVDWA